MVSDLSLFKEEQDDEIVVTLSGEIDISTVAKLREELYAIVDNNDKNLRLECTNLKYIDSTGLGVLVGVLKKVKKKSKDIYISNLNQNIKKLFVITGLNKVFIIEE
ncbi:MAG: STAS domain-containing protein [Clostridiaceae bacterium]|nr:STAS domain-containing protein [Clostridiaceae bacterium]